MDLEYLIETLEETIRLKKEGLIPKEEFLKVCQFLLKTISLKEE